MADQILRRLKPKLTPPPDNSLSTEKILESLAYERRVRDAGAVAAHGRGQPGEP